MKIIEAPNPVLSNNSQSVKFPFPSDLPRILKDMEKALLSAEDPKGVGLAAPQIGVGLRIFMAKPTDKAKTQIFINPEIISHTTPTTGPKKSKQRKLEGCLSLPSIWGTVKRSPSIEITFLDEKGKSHNKKLSGFMAVIAQHEIDHLEGILFPRRVLEQKGKLFKSFKNDRNEDEFEEIEI